MIENILTLCSTSHTEMIFRPDTWESLTREFVVQRTPEEGKLTPADVIARIGSADAAFTGWSTPAFTMEMLDAAPRLQLIAHLAGSVKFLYGDPEVRQTLKRRDIVVSAGVGGFATNVAESTIGLMIATSHRWREHDCAFSRLRHKSTGVPNNGQYLTGATVGLVSASTVARATLPLLKPFGCRILMYDPYLSKESASELGVELTDLDTVFSQSDIVSLHAPALPETFRMIGKRQLSLMRDGGILINTARGHVLDHDALIEECKTGRIIVALDVTDPEPLPRDSALWEMPNVTLLPHIAGVGYAGYHQVGEATLQALRDRSSGRPVGCAVPMDRWELLA